MRRLPFAALLVLAAACRPSPTSLRATDTPADVSLCGNQACTDTVSVKFLGVDGFVFRHGKSSVLTSPLFSRRGVVPTFFGFKFLSDTAVVRAALREYKEDLHDAQMVIVGHAHYDHLLDVPTLAEFYLPESARIVGSTTMKHILAPHLPSAQRVREVLPSEAGTSLKPGTWIYAKDSSSRVMPLKSSHASNFGPIIIAPGVVTSDYKKLPDDAQGWKLGEVYAYVIDLLDDNRHTVFRVFFQDAVPEPKYNTIPQLIGSDAHPVNLEVVVAGNFEKSRDYPTTAIDNIKPQRVVVGHWDDFFDPWTAKRKVIIFTDTKTLVKRLDERMPGLWVTPLPGAVMTFFVSK